MVGDSYRERREAAGKRDTVTPMRDKFLMGVVAPGFLLLRGLLLYLCGPLSCAGSAGSRRVWVC